MADGICKHPGCDREAYSKGYCFTHYQRQRMNKDMDAPIIPRATKAKRVGCEATGCKEKHFAKGYCKFHYWRHIRGSDINAPLQGSVKLVELPTTRVREDVYEIFSTTAKQHGISLYDLLGRIVTGWADQVKAIVPPERK